MKRSEPKSKKGRRKIVLLSVVVEALREHKARQEEACIKMGDRWEERGLIFCNVRSGYLNGDRLWYLFKRLLKSTDLPNVRFHDLRHGAANGVACGGCTF